MHQTSFNHDTHTMHCNDQELLRAKTSKKKFVQSMLVASIVFYSVTNLIAGSSLERNLLSAVDARLSEEDLKLSLAMGDTGSISRKNKLIYTRIPKTGGSTVEHSELFRDELFSLGWKAGGHHSIWKMTQKNGRSHS